MKQPINSLPKKFEVVQQAPETIFIDDATERFPFELLFKPNSSQQ